MKKHSTFNRLRTVLAAVGFIGLLALSAALLTAHRAVCPTLPVWLEQLSDNALLAPLIALPICLAFMGMMLFQVQCGLRSGYTLVHANLLLLQISVRNGKRRITPGVSRRSTLMLPPRTDSTAPWKLFLLSPFLFCGVLMVMLSLLTALLWRTPAARATLMFLIVLAGFLLALLLPRRNIDFLSIALLCASSPEYVRAWACSCHIMAAQQEGRFLADMPEEWFPALPEDVLDQNLTIALTINAGSRLIRLRRFKDARARLLPLLPRTSSVTRDAARHANNAAVLLNLALCESALDLPADCLNRLDDPAIRYMLPPAWKPRLMACRYARSLRLDPGAAASLLPQELLDALKADPDELALLEQIRQTALKKECLP